MSIKKTIPKETPKRQIQSYNCAECYSTFDARHKLKKHTTEQHEGKFVKSPERKSPRIEPKMKRKLNNSSNEESQERVEEDGKEMDVNIVNIEFEEFANLHDLLT